MRMTMKKLILASLLLSTALLAAGSAYAAPLYFPHVATNFPWQTEIAIINTSANQVTGTLRGLSDGGQLIETKNVTLAARGRRQIIIADEFTNHADIGYIIFDTNSAAVRGYTKFYQAGSHRAAIPAVKEVNTSDIYISHIASNADWWTGVSLVNTTSATKVLTITFNNGQSFPYPLNANEHRVFEIADEFFNNQPRPDIESAVITNASGVIGLELFGSKGGATHMDGILLTGTTTSTIYYPHVASNDYWWTGIVAYNPSVSVCTITITPYSAQGTPLSPSTLSIPGKGKYIGAVAALDLPAQTAWFKIDSTSPITGFELFGTVDGNQLAAYAEKSGAGAKAGVFAKIEKNGWTGIAFVNTEASAASVTLTAYTDNGTAVATQMLPVGGHAKVVNNPELIFSQDISSATYIAYSSDRNVVGFQLNGSSDGMMLDGLPGLAGTNAPLGLNRSNPYNRAQTVSAPHWDVKVIDTIRGSAAWQAISAANQFNDPPPAGMEYLLVKIHVKSTYTDNNAHSIGEADFRVTGDSLRENWFASVVSPSPALDANLFAGGEAEGWAPYLVGTGEGKLILIVDELFNFTDGHLRFIALDDGASISVYPGLGSIIPTTIGRERSSPALLTEIVTTEDWEISVQQVVRGDAAWLMVKDANQFNDPPAAGREYVAAKLRARYISTIDKSEPTNNLYIRSTGNANVLYDHPSVVDSDPKFDATLFPGGSYEGWVVTQVATGETGIMLVIESLFDFSGVNTRYLSLE